MTGMKTSIKRNLVLSITILLVLSLVYLSVVCAFAESLSESNTNLSELSAVIDTGATITIEDADENGFYDIDTDDALYAFSVLVNEGNENINAELISNIVVNKGTISEDTKNARIWLPINSSYTGIFNGNNNTISGLYFNDETMSCVGLFKSVSDNGKIENLGVINSYFNGKNTVGGIVGTNGGEINNCYFEGTVNSDGYYIGGIVGDNGGGKTTKCYNAGTVIGSEYVGGVAGYNYSGKISNCYSIGDVSAISSVGGIAGVNLYGEITNCYNSGMIVGTFNYIGDICGYNSKKITNCYYLKSNFSHGGVGYTANGGQAYTQAKTIKQFESGEVACLLQGDQFYKIWGQNIGIDVYPNFYGERVYKFENNDEIIFSNTNFNTEPPTATTEVSMTTDSTETSTEASVVTELTATTTGGSAVTESTVVIDPTEITTASVAITTPTEITTESIVVTDPTETATVSAVVTDPTEVTKESTVVNEPIETTNESTVATDPIESTTESTVVTESTEPSTSGGIATDTSESILTSTPDETKPSEPSEDKGILGDVNGDGKVNIKDATQIQKFAAKLIDLTDEEKLRADVNADNKNNVKDATVIQKYVAKIETSFPVGEKIY